MHGPVRSRRTRTRVSFTRGGFTLLELIIALVIAGILCAVAIPRTGALLDNIAVNGAANDVEAMLTRARHTAMTRGERATVDVDTARSVVSLRIGYDTLQRRQGDALSGVHFRATRTSVTYTQLGMGFGVSNLTLIISKGAAAETVTVSRLGRVRR